MAKKRQIRKKWAPNAIFASAVYATQNQAIHKGFSTLGMSYGSHKETWTALFRDICRRQSITGLSDLTLRERYRLIGHLRQRGVKLYNPPVPQAMGNWQKGDAEIEVARKALKGKKAYSHPGRPKDTDHVPYLQKIEAYLAEAGRPWKYAEAIARHMFGIDKLQWCDGDQLRRVMLALKYDARRHGFDGDDPL